MLVVLFAAGIPVAFAFAVLNVVGAVILLGTGGAGLQQLIVSMFGSVANFNFLAVVFFILMGELMFQSGVATLVLDTLDKLLGRLPGRLSLLAIVAGTVLGAVSGVSMAVTALLGKMLTPEMMRRGYQKPMTIGPILAAGRLDSMIPPSTLAVMLGAIGQISIGRILIAIILPGLVMAVIYAIYIIIISWLQPSLAPPYEVTHIPMSRKLIDTVRYVLPIGLIVFLVTGVIFLGVATPSEAAALGAVGCVLLSFVYRELNWEMMRKSFLGTLRATFMLLIIVSGATAFAQILAFTGATQGLVEFATGFTTSPIFMLIAMMVLVILLGLLMEAITIMLITLPMFMPIVSALGIDPVWFAVIMLLAILTGGITPPFGLDLFTMKAVAPPGVTMDDIVRAAVPPLLWVFASMALIIAFPALALWLPGLM